MILEKSVYMERTFYQKNGEKSYIVIKSGEEPKIPYQINMIRYNKISGLLPIQFFIEDGEYQYFYDISAKESLAERMKQKKYSIKEIRTIMSDLYRCEQQMEEYLLDVNCLILEPEYMFSDKNKLNIYFCFYQDKNEPFEKSLEGLFEYFMNRIDYQDEKTVLLVYGLYQKSKEEHTSLHELMKQFCEASDSNSEQKCKEETDIHENFEKIEKQDKSFNKMELEKEAFGFPNKKNKSLSEWRNRFKKAESDKTDIKKKYKYYSLIPYISDIIAAYGIARILWYIAQNRTWIEEKEFMLWIFAIVGILAGCGVFSTLFSGYMDKKVKGIQKENLERKGLEGEKIDRKEFEKNKIHEKNFTENMESIDQEQDRINKWQDKVNNLQSRETQWEKKNYYPKKVNPEKNEEIDHEKRMFDEFIFLDEVENKENRDIGKNETGETNRDTGANDFIPATVVMSEPELFRAFNPALISKEKEKFPDILLKEKNVVIGKINGIADICLKGKGISRVHARISQDKKGCSVIDLGSTNGTYVNGILLKERQRRYLEKGDEVRFAEAVYEFIPAERENVHSHQISDVV